MLFFSGCFRYRDGGRRVDKVKCNKKIILDHKGALATEIWPVCPVYVKIINTSEQVVGTAAQAQSQQNCERII